MKSEIYYCDACSQYTTEEICPLCQKKTRVARPPKFSPDDKYAKYRRMAKENLK